MLPIPQWFRHNLKDQYARSNERPGKGTPEDEDKKHSELKGWQARELSEQGPLLLNDLEKAFKDLTDQNTEDGEKAKSLAAYFALQTIGDQVKNIRKFIGAGDLHGYKQLEIAKTLATRIRTLGLNA